MLNPRLTNVFREIFDQNNSKQILLILPHPFFHQLANSKRIKKGKGRQTGKIGKHQS